MILIYLGLQTLIMLAYLKQIKKKYYLSSQRLISKLDECLRLATWVYFVNNRMNIIRLSIIGNLDVSNALHKLKRKKYILLYVCKAYKTLLTMADMHIVFSYSL